MNSKPIGDGNQTDSSIDDRSPTAKAMSKVSEILASCLLMIIPALIGIWLDRALSTVVLFTILGLVLGLTGAVLQLKRLVVGSTELSYDPAKIIKYQAETEEDALADQREET